MVAGYGDNNDADFPRVESNCLLDGFSKSLLGYPASVVTVEGFCGFSFSAEPSLPSSVWTLSEGKYLIDGVRFYGLFCSEVVKYYCF